MVDDRAPVSELISTFDQSRDQAAHDKALQDESDHLQYEISVKDGMLSEESVSKITNKGRILSSENTPDKKEERRRRDQEMIINILDQMRERLAVLEQLMAERYIVLQERYGEDAMGGMAAEFLGDRAAALRTEHERMEAACTVLAVSFIALHG